MRLSPYRYYTSVLVDSMKEDAPYDSIPNFTVSSHMHVLGTCRGRLALPTCTVQHSAAARRLLWMGSVNAAANRGSHARQAAPD